MSGKASKKPRKLTVRLTARRVYLGWFAGVLLGISLGVFSILEGMFGTLGDIFSILGDIFSITFGKGVVRTGLPKSERTNSSRPEVAKARLPVLYNTLFTHCVLWFLGLTSSSLHSLDPHYRDYMVIHSGHNMI